MDNWTRVREVRAALAGTAFANLSPSFDTMEARDAMDLLSRIEQLPPRRVILHPDMCRGETGHGGRVTVIVFIVVFSMVVAMYWLSSVSKQKDNTSPVP